MSVSKKVSTIHTMDSQQLHDVQQQLDHIQDSGVTPQYMRYVLFQKMLDVYQVPKDHTIRSNRTPDRLDDPTLISQLKRMGFSKQKTLH
ncbi:hypothetical protein AAEU32_03400 [Pseudoalteromonas sp. SSDWG2]|uniref:hypothetical protein n=1 Tax=Pseudoalteromonas sp. SSDWG2 TaxID=3139391 RepID=UPI003BAD1A60